jgi:hypothetical protein
MSENKPKIFVFGPDNGGNGMYYAIAEDGAVLGSHFCSNWAFARGDLGVIPGSRPDRHKTYAEHYPQGYEMEFVHPGQAKGHKALQEAIRIAESKEAPAPPENAGHAQIVVTLNEIPKTPFE